jgi:hypothetical protein
MFCSSQFLSTLFAVGAARPRKKNSAAKKNVTEENSLFAGGETSPFVLATQVVQPPHGRPIIKDQNVQFESGVSCFRH